MTIRVLIADDHPVVRAGLRAVLELSDDLAVVADVGSVEAAVARVRAGGVDVVLMDLQFGEQLLGIEGTAQLTALPDAPRVLVLTTYDTEADVLAALDAGAVGYLLKDAEPDALAEAIRSTARGQTALAPSVATRLTRRVTDTGGSLSRRELEVLDQVAAGHSNEEIARRLFLSRATVKSHLAHAYVKLGVDSRTSAVAAARSQGLIRGS